MHTLNGHAERREETFEREFKHIVRTLSRQISQLSQAFSELENFQAGGGEPRFEPSPLEYLEHFESLTNEIEKQHFFHKHKEVIAVGQEAREWAELKREAAREARAAQPKPGSLAAKYEELAKLDPQLGRKFFEVNHEGIKNELQASFLERKAPAART